MTPCTSRSSFFLKKEIKKDRFWGYRLTCRRENVRKRNFIIHFNSKKNKKVHFQPGSHSASVENLKVAPSAELLRSSSRLAKKKKKKKKEIKHLSTSIRYQNAAADQNNPRPRSLIIYIAAPIFIYFLKINKNCPRRSSAAVQDGIFDRGRLDFEFRTCLGKTRAVSPPAGRYGECATERDKENQILLCALGRKGGGIKKVLFC